MASVGYAGLLSGLACSEGASPILCGGGAGGSFSDVGAAYSIQPPSSYDRRHYRSPSPHTRRMYLEYLSSYRTARTRPPIELNSYELVLISGTNNNCDI